jgi:hypothetical protein
MLIPVPGDLYQAIWSMKRASRQWAIGFDRVTNQAYTEQTVVLPSQRGRVSFSTAR